jgi:hypothetical protein
MKALGVFILMICCLPLAAQTPAFEDLEFEADSVASAYKPSGKNYVLIKSKRGTGGLNKTAAGDAITAAEVTEIVLVFTETDRADITEREEANQERWENLLKTYPEYFQYSTTYKNLCQCKIGADPEALKIGQGFYVYINGEVPKVAAEAPKQEVIKAEAPKKESPKVVETPVVPPTEAAKTTNAGKVEKKIDKEPVAATNIAVPDKTDVKAKETPAVKEAPTKEVSETIVNESKTQTTAVEPEEVVKVKPKKKTTGVAKSRRTKDPKACRMACYENGIESLDAFLKDNIGLSRKERRKAKKMDPIAKLQLNVDGSIKKVMVTCPDEVLNLKITEAFKSMSPWNATVRNGATVKSEVKVTLKFDKKAKTFKAFEVAVTPRLPIKCKCASDSELFD